MATPKKKLTTAPSTKKSAKGRPKSAPKPTTTAGTSGEKTRKYGSRQLLEKRLKEQPDQPLLAVAQPTPDDYTGGKNAWTEKLVFMHRHTELNVDMVMARMRWIAENHPSPPMKGTPQRSTMYGYIGGDRGSRIERDRLDMMALAYGLHEDVWYWPMTSFAQWVMDAYPGYQMNWAPERPWRDNLTEYSGDEPEMFPLQAAA